MPQGPQAASIVAMPMRPSRRSAVRPAPLPRAAGSCGGGLSNLNFVVWHGGASSLPLKGGGWRPTGPAFGRPDDRLQRRVGVSSPRRFGACGGTPTRIATRSDLLLSGGGVPEGAAVSSYAIALPCGCSILAPLMRSPCVMPYSVIAMARSASRSRAESFSLALFNCPQAARMSRPRGVRTGEAWPAAKITSENFSICSQSEHS